MNSTPGKLGCLFAAILLMGILPAWAQVTQGKPQSLPAPHATPSVNNPPHDVRPPAGFLPKASEGFKVSVFARDFDVPRWLAVAPDGDIFVADSGAGKVIVLRNPKGQDHPASRFTFAEGLHQPFGIAFHEDYVYIGDTDEVIRFRYDPKTSKRLGSQENLLALPGGGYNQHWTRTVTFSPDGKKLYVSVGSKHNVAIEKDWRRAAVIVCDLDGKNAHVFATGLRNAVGIGFNPQSGELWASVNERDGLGDNVPPDYFAHVVQGGFYGWPYSYIGKHVDHRIKPQRPDLVEKAIVPDVLLQPHAAALQFIFYQGTQFPQKYRHGAFIAEHGSWNRSRRSGYQVVFVPFQDGKPSGNPMPFLEGFIPDPAGQDVYGRPVGVAEMHDGSLLVSDDGGKVIWRITYSK